MNDIALFQTWHLWLVIAAVLILVAATLLILVNRAAQRIYRLAAAALQLVAEIKMNTSSIWGLQQTNEVASGILKGSGDIKDHLNLVATALHELDEKK